MPPNTEDALRVPQGYRHSVVVRWGDPLTPGGPAFDFEHQTPEAQAVQFGYNNDFTGLVPTGDGRWLMVCNHEYTTEPLMFRGYNSDNPTEAQVRISLAAHGLSVLAVERDPSGALRPSPDPRFNRRITATTELQLTGPAAGSPLLRTAVDLTGTKVLGTLNNCAGSVTPWGTVLSGEENFNQYFANAD
ncbi:MAG: PhoX family protein, partial [Actinomycetota bacterium]|nr:PhoX family protein [Actinomycetota bacterium]